ncbi:MAG: alcohol dehydrogenase catalytic domain-containing protein [Gemmatimonadota bacterium]
MRALRFDVTVPGFLRARTLGPLGEAATFGALSNLRSVELPRPEPRGPHWVGLRVLAAGICGTDLATLRYQASPSLEPFGSFPAVLGHEVLAEVESVGSEVTRVRPGDRVAVDPMLSCEVRGHPAEQWCLSCRSGWHSTCEMAGEEGGGAEGPHSLKPGLTIGYHADLPGGWGERMIAHESQLFPVPDGVPKATGVLVEPLSIAMHAVLNAAPADGGDDVLVIGSGPIALGTVWALRASGYKGTIVAQTKRDHEGELALRMGADEVVKPGFEARQVLVETGAQAYQPILGDEVFAGGGFPLVFDCVGSRSSLLQAMGFAAPRGRVVMLGCAAKMSGLDLTPLWSRELEVRGFVGYGAEEWRGARRHTFEITLELLRETEAPVGELVTHTFPLERYRDALSAAADHRRSGAVKVVMEP